MNPMLIRIAYRGSFLMALTVGLLALAGGASVMTALARAGVALFVTSLVAWALIVLTMPLDLPKEAIRPAKPEADAAPPAPIQAAEAVAESKAQSPDEGQKVATAAG